MNSSTDILVLAQTAWGEARGEGHDGMQAVCNVVMNRVAQPGWWGHDVLSVCQKPYQFSAWNADGPNRKKMLAVTAADPQFKDALGLAAQAVGGSLPDLTNGATSYHEASISPYWARGQTPVATIGHHVFYQV